MNYCIQIGWVLYCDSVSGGQNTEIKVVLVSDFYCYSSRWRLYNKNPFSRTCPFQNIFLSQISTNFINGTSDRPTNTVNILITEVWRRQICPSDHDEILHKPRQLFCLGSCRIPLLSARYERNYKQMYLNYMRLKIVSRLIFVVLTQWRIMTSSIFANTGSVGAL